MSESTIDKDAIRERCEKATPGEWELTAWDGGHCSLIADNYEIADLWHVPRCQAEANADLIAHARTDIPRLLDALDATERERDDNAATGVDLAMHLGRCADERDRLRDENKKLKQKLSRWPISDDVDI